MIPRALLALTAVAWACGAEPAPPDGVPPRVRAAWVIEPTRLGLGEVATIELAVVTPPDHAVRRFRPPERIEGLWLVGSEVLPVEREAERWVHRTRLRLHARRVGRFVWPAASVQVEPADGEPLRIELEEVPIEVVSVLPEHPERTTPFGVRAPAPPPARVPALAAAAAGAALALAGVAVAALLRRRARTARAARPAARPAGPTPWAAAREVLAGARDRAAADPRAAADAAARALRRYAAGRFGADATARTTEELAAAVAPFVATSRWPALVSILERLDALRFPASAPAGARASRERVEALLDEAEAFVEESTPEAVR